MKEFFTKLAKFFSLLGFLAIAGICTLMLLGPVVGKALGPTTNAE